MKNLRIKAFQKFWIKEERERMSYDQAEIMQHNEWGEEYFECNKKEYLVLTESEAKEKARESIENYIDDCVLSEAAERYRDYFDSERFIEDCICFDGIAHTLATYDGEEHEVDVKGETFFVSRLTFHVSHFHSLNGL